MSQRRTCSDRPRGWSQESGSSQDEVIVYQGNRAVKQPERQPDVPPTETRAQKDKGFARFLKKHSSPTHQRVTTGGRIVPMERQARPPVFSLPHTEQHMEEHKNSSFDGANGIIKLSSTGHDQARGGVADNILQSQSFMPDNIGVVADASTFNAGTDANVMTPINPFGFEATRIQPNYLQAMPPAPYYSSMPGDPYSTMMMHPHMFQGNAMPLVGFNGGVSPFAMPYVPSPQMIPSSVGIATTPMDPQSQGGSNNEHMLNESFANFQHLDEQLKGLDRHRAMNEHDPCVANQRMAIVQLRAQAKEQITYWSNKVGLDAQSTSNNPIGAANSRLNVQASSYVPLRAHQTAETSSDNSSSSWKPSADQGVGKPDFVVDNTHRPIPIVPPPGKLPSPQMSDRTHAAPKSESVKVDEWGVRVGPAPLEIQRKQSQMLKELARQTSISPQDLSENAVMFTPQGSHGITPPAHAAESKASNSDTGFGSESEWLPTKPGRAPPTVEACYEVQLDAMRLPPGLVSKVRLPDGTITEVRGCGLKRPPSFEMDEFEQRYWTTKPALPREAFDNFVEVRDSDGEIDSASIIEYLDINRLKLESDSTKMNGNTKGGLSSSESEGSGKYANSSMNVAKDTTNAQTLLRSIDRHGYASTIEPSTVSDARPVTLKLSSASSPPMWSQGDDRVGWFANEHSRNGRLAGSEAPSSKGFSSVSIQNVHAMGRLPHVDGPSDGQRLSALSMLSAASKAASPQPTPGSVPSSESFYGPYPREARGTTGASDDVFRPGMPQGQDM